MKFTFIQKSIVATVGAVALLGSTAGAGHAFNFTEAGDQSATAPGSAVGATTGTDYLNGIISSTTDADLYSFIVGATSTFRATVTGSASDPLVDSQLFLFDSMGKALKANDDRSATNTLSRINTITLAAGTYFLGISSFDYDPTNASGNFLFPNAQLGQRNPISQADQLLAGWAPRSAKTSPGGGYTITIDTTKKVPTPALLPGLAALGFGAIRKRKAKAAVA
jgi:hypothetical protein